nr:unnamed protein product [Callosobruchus analis]
MGSSTNRGILMRSAEADMAKSKGKTREEILKKKQENERKRYERIKKDPGKLAAYKEKDKQKYLKKELRG